VSPFVTIFAAGVLGGIASGLVIALALIVFGRRIGEDLLNRQIAHLETRFRESFLDATLTRIAAFLDRGERLSQIVKRVVEIIQLLFRPGEAAPSDAALQGIRDLATAAAKPGPPAANGS